MEQQSQKREIEDSVTQIPDVPIMCANSCGFFGSASANNLCSKCYRDYFLKQSKTVVVESESVEVTTPSTSTPQDPVKQTPPTNRCNFCRKRVGLTGFKCRCGCTFCDAHRYSDKHNCPFDYKTAGQDAIAKANPIVKADKIEKI